MNGRLDRGRVQPQRVSGDLFLRHRATPQSLVDALPSRGSDRVLELVERGEIHHGLHHPQPCELAETRAAIDTDDGLTQREPLQGLDDQEPENVLGREAKAPRPRCDGLTGRHCVLQVGVRQLRDRRLYHRHATRRRRHLPES